MVVVGVGKVLPAQQLQSEFYSINDGLSHKQVTNILLSRSGFVWIATSNGLNRFDGYDFLQIRKGGGNAVDARLSRNNIGRLGEDERGNIVVIYQNFSGFFDLLDPVTLEVTRVDLLPQKGIEGHPRDIAIGRDGKVYVTSIVQDGFTYLYRLVGTEFRKVWQIDDGWKSVAASVQTCPLATGLFLLYDTEHGMRLVDEYGQLIRQMNLAPYDPEARFGKGTYESLHFLHEDHLGRVWFSFFGRKGLFIWRGGEGEPGRYVKLPQNAYYTDIWGDQNGNLLIQESRRAGGQVDPIDLFCVTAEDEPINFGYLLQVGDVITTVAGRDFFRTIFFGINTGMKVVQNGQTRVANYLEKDLPDDRRGKEIGGITGDQNGHVYFLENSSVSSNYWYRIDQQTGDLDTVRLRDQNTGKPVRFVNGLDLQFDPKGYIWGLSATSSGNKGLLLRYDLHSCNVSSYIYNERFSCMTIDSVGRIWLGIESATGTGHLAVLEPETNQFALITDVNGQNFLQQSPPLYLYWGQEEQLWIGTQITGLYAYHPGTATVTYSTEGRQQDLLGDFVIQVIYQAEDQKLWLGTQNGLHIFDPLTESTERYTTQEGLAGNSIFGILPDDRGGYWISTSNGLSFFEPKTKTYRRYYRTDGLSSDEFNRFSFYRDDRDRYYFGGTNGLNVFTDKDLLVNRSTPNVLLTQIIRYGRDKVTMVSDLQNLEQLEIKEHEKSFAIQFALPVYTRPTRNRFRARLDGLDEDWVELNNEHTLRYNNLRGGQYMLYLQGADPNGNFSQDELILPIRVRQYFFEQTWFYILIFTLFVGLIFLFLQNRLQNRLHEERLRTRLSSDLHDEVSGLLAGITMQAELLQGATGDDKLRTRLQKIGEAGRKAMSKMGDVIWSIDSRRDNVGDLLTRMQEHADEVLLPLEIRYNLEVEKLEPSQKMPVNIRQDLYFIYKEAINNIAKHSTASRVEIFLRNAGSDFMMSIRDNGRGYRSDLPLRKGQGLSNLYMRASRLGANLDVIPGNGYQVNLKMRRFA